MASISILFVCHGNICRSPMAEAVFKELARKCGLQDSFRVASAAVSCEEIGNDIYPPAQRCLAANRIPFQHRAARKITNADFLQYDYIVCMDERNLRLLPKPPAASKASISLLLGDKSIADPWYSGDFDLTFREITAGCQALLEELAPKLPAPH